MSMNIDSDDNPYDGYIDDLDETMDDYDSNNDDNNDSKAITIFVNYKQHKEIVLDFFIKLHFQITPLFNLKCTNPII